MGTLSSSDGVTANETITVTFTGIVGGIFGVGATPESITRSIYQVFTGSPFVIESVTIPLLSEIEAPVLVGHFVDADGAGHSAIDHNLSYVEVSNFILSKLQTVSGLWDAGIAKIETGAQGPGNLLPSLGVTGWVIVALIVLTLGTMIFLKV